MAATPLSPENERELQALRARAYGPDADLSLDPLGSARLTELENLVHTPAGTATPTGPPATSQAETRDPVGVGSRRAWVPLSTLVVGAAVLGLGIGLATPGLMPPRPYAVLRALPSDGTGPTFTSYGVMVGAPTRYEKFHDLDVWSARLVDGTQCVLVISPTSTWRASGCAPRPLDPVADLSTHPVIRAIDGLDLPVGSLVRFILRDGAVHVWIDENAGPT